MEKHRTIPQGYMTVGELAKKMNTTVRTLQYYDKEGVLSSSAESEGGRRLYTEKDMVKLYQILSLKSLGFSLDDIKNRLISLDTPEDVANALTRQSIHIQEQIANLTEALRAIEALKVETLQMQTVDFKKYADIIVNLQMKNEFYGFIKYLDDTTLDHFRSRFDKDSGMAFMGVFNRMNDEAVRLLEEGVPPESVKGQTFAKEYWNMIMEFTGGDMGLFNKLVELPEKANVSGSFNAFLGPALQAYFTNLGVNPFEGVSQ